MMKKLLAMLLALVTLLSMAVVVSADETVLKEVVFADGVADDGWYAWIVKDDNFNGWWDKLQEENTQVVIKYTNSGSGDLYVSLTHWGSVNAVLATTVDGTDGYKYATVDASALVSAYKNDSGHYDDDNNIKIPNAMSMECWDTATESRLATIYSVSIVKNTTTDTTPTNTTPHITGLYYSYEDDLVIVGTIFRADTGDGTFSFTHPFTVKWYSGDELLTTTVRKENRDEVFEEGGSAPTLLRGSVEDSAVDGWYHNTWTPDPSKVPTKVEIWSNGTLLDTYVLADHTDDYYVQEILAAWRNTNVITGDTFEGNMPDRYNETSNVPTVSTGYFATGDETHAMIIGGAIITSNHVYNANGDCVYCGYHKDVVEDEVVIETPVESDTEEVDEDSTDDVEVDDKTEDTNPTTGVALAVAPMMVAALAVVASKRR